MHIERMIWCFFSASCLNFRLQKRQSWLMTQALSFAERYVVNANNPRFWFLIDCLQIVASLHSTFHSSFLDHSFLHSCLFFLTFPPLFLFKSDLLSKWISVFFFSFHRRRSNSQISTVLWILAKIYYGWDYSQIILFLFWELKEELDLTQTIHFSERTWRITDIRNWFSTN